MISFFRRLVWWLQSRRKEDELRAELQFHIAEEAEERRAVGMHDDEARLAARRDLGDDIRLREDVRAVWTWRPLEEAKQDLSFAFRTFFRDRAVTGFAAVSLALGIGAGTAIYSFMDAILFRSLPVADPSSLVQMTWHSRPFNSGSRARSGSEFVLHSIDGTFYDDATGVSGWIFPFPAFERLQQMSAPLLSSIFTHFQAGDLNVIVNGEAQLSAGQYVSGAFFNGLAVVPAAGRLITTGDDRAGAAPVAVVSHGYSERRFGSADRAVGKPVLVNNVAFTVIGVTPREFFGVDPGSAPALYLPIRAILRLNADAGQMLVDPNYYWTGIMGRLRPGVTLREAESALAPVFNQWVTPTAGNDRERANLPQLRVESAAAGLDTLRRTYSKPLFLLLAMVGVILSITCANTANLLLARATARQREIAVRLSIGASRPRLIRQLLTEAMVLASISGALGVLIAVGGTRLLSVLLANGADEWTLHADLNWRVLAVTAGLSILCGVLFGLAPAILSTRTGLMAALKDTGQGQAWRLRASRFPQLRLQHVLVVSQISLVVLLLVAASLLVRTLTKLQSIPLGFDPGNMLLFDVNAPQAGHPESHAATFYIELRERLAVIPGVRGVTVSHASLMNAGRGHPTRVDGALAEGTRFLQIGPDFFSTWRIPILRGREIDARDRSGTLPVAVVSDLFARNFFPNQDPLGRHIAIGGSLPMDVEVVGVAATARYGGLKNATPPVVYVAFPQIPTKQVQQMTYALRTDDDPMRYAAAVRQIVHDADARIPVVNVRTQAAEIERMINQEIVLARLATAFAVVALVVACVGLYGTIAYAVARRTREIGVRIALGARSTAVIWMVLREVSVLAALGLLISVPIARAASRFVATFLFQMEPNDPRAIAAALLTLITATAIASYAPARRATRIDPATALRDE